jgi:hypothetical protein
MSVYSDKFSLLVNDINVQVPHKKIQKEMRPAFDIQYLVCVL